MILAGGYRGILVAAASLLVLAGAVTAAPITPFTFDTVMNVVSPSSLNFNVQISSDVGSDSDSASSPLGGTANVRFFADASTGNLTIKDYQFTGGLIQVNNNLALDFTLGGFLVNIDATGTGLKGVPSTLNPPSTLTSPAVPGSPGSFPASDARVTINQGNIHVVVSPFIGSDTIIDLDLSNPDNQIAGTSTSATPGTLTVNQGASDTSTNTTKYSLVLNVPVQFTSEPIDLDGQGTATITVNGSLRTSVADVEVNFIPWNGIAGDLTQDGQVNSADITAFVNGWRSTNNTPGRLAIQKGDLNFDGLTDLHDAFLLRSALQDNNLSLNIGDLLAVSNTVPEPSTWMLLAVGCVAMVARRRLAK
ncbi:PEP-CTERM sorting domain-containing protein [Aeoliella sp. SH292]|uniref:PEP-CTERM sorting domain-containing protein n=1 Tax=Aeoliella sp. SH292 TaxID=3454464 RepID=UPI003F9B51AE